MIKSVDAAGRVFFTIDTNQLQASSTSTAHPLLTNSSESITSTTTAADANADASATLSTDLIIAHTHSDPDNSTSSVLIELRHVNFYYTSRLSKRVLTNVNLVIPKYSFTCLIGQSGVGKSTLFNILCGLQKLEEPSSGDILLNEEHISKLDPLWLYKNVRLVL